MNPINVLTLITMILMVTADHFVGCATGSNIWTKGGTYGAASTDLCENQACRECGATHFQWLWSSTILSKDKKTTKTEGGKPCGNCSERSPWP